MPTIVGTDAVTSLSRHIVLPTIVDQFYTESNALFFRWNQANKKNYEGGTHIEVPVLTSGLVAGGAYEGFDLLDVSPSDTIRNLGFDMKQYYAPVTFDGRTLARANSSMAVANIVTTGWEQARMDLADKLGDDLYSDGGTAKKIIGLDGVVDDGSTLSSYGGVSRSASGHYLDSQIDSSTATLTLSSINSLMMNCQKGGRGTSVILSRKEQYNRAWALLIANQQYQASPTGSDENLASAGFKNILFNNVPWIIDDKVDDGPNTSNSAIYLLDEDPWEIALWGNTDFMMEDFQKPVNQDAVVGKLLWWGCVYCKRPQTQGKMTNVSA